MGPAQCVLIAGFCLAGCVLHCTAQFDAGYVKKSCILPAGLNAQSWCPLSRNPHINDFYCSVSSEIICDKDTRLVEENSFCWPGDGVSIVYRCISGAWKTEGSPTDASREKRAVLATLGAIAKGVGLVSTIVSGVKDIVGAVKDIICIFFCKDKEEKQNHPPQFNYCPSDITKVAPPGEREAVAEWTEPSASDPDGETPSVERRGPAPGGAFPEGSTSVTYVARDGQGFTDYCYFIVTVTVKECPPPPYLLNGEQNCDKGFVYGSVCSQVCHPGYSLTGAADITCRADEAWFPDPPTCEPVSCGSPQSVGGGQVACPGQPVYPESCSVICQRGYYHSGSAGSFYVTCQQNATWTTAQDCDDVESPKFPSGCPTNQQLNSGPLQSPVAVTWTDPVTTDNSGGSVTLTSVPARGSSLAVGFHLVRITATDDSGNSASCNFLVSIQPRKCPSLSAPAYGRVVCSSGYVEGSECTVSCYPGYEVQGGATLKCLDTEQWNTSLPVCQAVTCPNPPQVDNGDYVCSTGRQYPAACSLVCNTGFTTQNSTFVQCMADGTWSLPGSCRDVEAPQFDHGCVDNIEIYQSRLGAPTPVQWNPPAVTDNSGGAVQLTSDIPSGSDFPLGVTRVTYTATDVSNNSRSCRFSITVTTLSCDAPSFDASGRGLMTYDCSDGHVYGATCTLDCTHGYPLVGADTITCERDDSTHPPTMVWEWSGPSAVAPVCRENNCTDLPAPQNGALTCNLGNFGWDCMMSCQQDWDVPAQTDGHFYCTNSNNYWLPSTVPNCLIRILPGRVRLNFDLFYYTGTCNSSESELKTKFIERMNSSAVLRDACANSCHLENLKVTCGPTSGRRRRDVESKGSFQLDGNDKESVHGRYNRWRRQAEDYYALFAFQVVIDYDEGSSTKQEAFQSLQATKDTIYTNLTSTANSGQLDFDDFNAAQYAVGYPSVSVDCPAGTIYRPRDNTDSFSCAGCGAGYYLPFDPSTGTQASQCEACPVGSYTDLDNATSCTPCPQGWSTLGNASTSSLDCKPLCHAGNVSHNGFVPCQPCPPGRYQSRDGATSCDLCPAGTWADVVGSTSLGDCLPSEVLLNNTALRTNVSGQWSDLTMTAWLLLGDNAVASVTLDLDTGDDDSVSTVVFSGDRSAAGVPSNGTRSVSVAVQANTWTRVIFVVDSQTRTSSIYLKASLVLSYVHNPFAGSGSASLAIVASSTKVQVSGLHASDRKLSQADITTPPRTCAGNTSENLLVWSPSPSSLILPPECDAVDECEGSPCGLHPCENLVDGFVCHCQDGWSGDTCSTAPDPCDQHGCLNGATCVPTTSNYTCTCPSGFTGNICQLEIVDGGWGDWSAWTECSATCGGGGQQQRQRLCDNPAPLNGGAGCTGDTMETVACGEPVCPVHGNWSAWGLWSTCSATCGGGERTRQRACDDPVPQHGGDDCEGHGLEVDSCNTDLCPVHGNWTPWSDWTQCSVTCGDGSMSRTRTCANPPPANGGNACTGSSSETLACNNGDCPECATLIRPAGSLLLCEDTQSPFLRTCNLTCAPGYESALTTPQQYLCGEETSYLWSHQRETYSRTNLPVICQRATSIDQANLVLSVNVNAGCDDTAAKAVKNGVQQNSAASVPCVKENKCQSVISTSCSGNSGRRKRSTGSLVVSVHMTYSFDSNVVLDINDTATLVQYIESLGLVEKSALAVIGNNTHNIFSVAVGNQVISPDLATLTYTANLVCPQGSGAVQAVCVECPMGYKGDGGFCVPCPLGQYQDQPGSTFCKPCPAGLTWDVLAAYSVFQCIYPYSQPVTTTFSSTSGTTTHGSGPKSHKERDGRHANLVYIIVGVVCGAAVLLLLAIVFAVYKCKNRKTQGYSRSASFASMGNQVHPHNASRPMSPSAMDPMTMIASRPATATHLSAFPSYPLSPPPPYTCWVPASVAETELTLPEKAAIPK